MALAKFNTGQIASETSGTGTGNVGKTIMWIAGIALVIYGYVRFIHPMIVKKKEEEK